MLSKNISTFIGCDAEYEDAKIVLFGAPFDSTTSYRPGTRFASQTIRNESYGLETYSPYQDKDMADYSAGQKKKVLLARSLCESAHLYLWDEPLNYIDVLSRMQIEQLLLDYRPTMLFVEHDAAFVRRAATGTLVL